MSISRGETDIRVSAPACHCPFSVVERDSLHFVPVNCLLLSIISLQHTKGVLSPQLLPTL